jgi:hypothetical protein
MLTVVRARSMIEIPGVTLGLVGVPGLLSMKKFSPSSDPQVAVHWLVFWLEGSIAYHRR